MSEASELRAAAEKLGHWTPPDEYAEIVVNLAKSLSREADIVTTLRVLQDAGYAPELLLSAAPEFLALARAVNRSIL